MYTHVAAYTTKKCCWKLKVATKESNGYSKLEQCGTHFRNGRLQNTLIFSKNKEQTWVGEGREVAVVVGLDFEY